MAHKSESSREIDSAATTYTVRLGARGRVVLPAPMRAQLKLREGDELILSVTPEGTFTGESRRNAWLRLRGMFAHLAPAEGSLVDDLIAERREEAKREDAGF